jgi:hypothetical protein
MEIGRGDDNVAGDDDNTSHSLGFVIITFLVSITCIMLADLVMITSL